jgi:hypothetical protein
LGPGIVAGSLTRRQGPSRSPEGGSGGLVAQQKTSFALNNPHVIAFALKKRVFLACGPKVLYDFG